MVPLLPEFSDPKDELNLGHNKVAVSRRRQQGRRKKNPGGNDRASIPGLKYGVEVPRMVKEAYELDTKNGNKAWQGLLISTKDAGGRPWWSIKTHHLNNDVCRVWVGRVPCFRSNF